MSSPALLARKMKGQHAMHRIFVLACLLAAGLPPVTASAADTLVLGQKNNQTYTGYENCPEETTYICMTGWYRWTIRVEKTVSGPPLPARIVAVIGQHTYRIVRWPYPRQLFVVRPIEDPELRATLHADYIVDDEARRADMYCGWTDPKDLGLDVEVFANGNGSYCFEMPAKD